MSLIKTTFYAVSDKGSGGSGSGTGWTKNVTNVTNTEFATEAQKLAEARLIWGQPFDGTSDITGDFLLDTNNKMEVYGPWKAGSYYAKEISYVRFSPTGNASEHSLFNFRRTDVDMEDSPIHMWSNDSGNILNLDVTGIMNRLVNDVMRLDAHGLNFTADAEIHSDG